MPQFFVDRSFEIGGRVKITGKDAHHILNVLRLKSGDRLMLSDGKGRSYEAQIELAGSKTVDVKITGEVARRDVSPSPALAFAVIKHDRSEWIIQKAVELGCRQIVPFYCVRTIPKLKSADKKIGRWREIALGAAKQSGLPFVPAVERPVDFSALCRLFPDFDKAILFWEGERASDLRSCVSGLVSRVLLIIGPEGGFEKEEVELAKTAGALTVSLGQQILRVETAAITALAIVQYELGNLDPPKRRGEMQFSHRGTETQRKTKQ